MKSTITKLLNSGYPASVRQVLRNHTSTLASPALLRTGHDGLLKVASYNVHKCVGLDGQFDPERIGKVIAELSPDIIALQEADRRFGDRAGLLDLARIEQETGLVAVPIRGNGLSHGWHGNLILVREGLVEGVRQVTLPGLEPRGALVSDLDFGKGRSMRVIGAHLGLLRHSRRKQAAILAEHLESEDRRPGLLMGDLNEWRVDNGSPLARLSNPLRDHSPPSFPARRPLLSLDRIFSTQPSRMSETIVHQSELSRIASDHLPIMAQWAPET